MGNSNIEDSRDIMDRGICRIKPSISRTNSQTHESSADNDRPPGILSGIAVSLVLNGIPLLLSYRSFIGATFSGDFLIFLEYTLPFGTGLLMFASGWGIARLERWSLYSAIFSLGIFIVILYLHSALGSYPFSLNRVWAILSIAIYLMMMLYLLRPDIRSRFQ